MTRRLISQGSPFEANIGYSRAVVDRDWVLVSGTTGYDYATMEISPDPAEQTRQTLRNIGWSLEQAGARFKDVVRVHYILTNREDWPLCWDAVCEVFGDVRPAATMLIAELQEPAMKIEIEVTARITHLLPVSER